MRKEQKPQASPASSDEERQDALLRYAYGPAFDEFSEIDKTFLREYQKGLNDGWKEGYRQGIKSGRRLAKGKSEFSKSRGAPKLLGHDLLSQQFVEFVNREMSTRGISLPAAVSKYRTDFEPAWEGLMKMPDQEKLLRLYKRKKEAFGARFTTNRRKPLNCQIHKVK